MADLPVALPEGHALLSIAERPDLWRPMSEVTTAAWPEFMNHDEVANRLWHHLGEAFAPFQLVLLDPAGRIVAAENAAPLAWGGTDAGLPACWEDQFEQSVADLGAGRPPTSLGAIQIVVAPDLRGTGLATLMLEAMRANAIASGLRSIIACVRPNQKADYPLIPIEHYARWTRPDGLPFDAWMRIHARLGARLVRPEPRSMTIAGSIADWQAWTGLAFPGSGDYLLPGATSVLTVDRDAGTGVHYDENVWMVHDLPEPGLTPA